MSNASEQVIVYTRLVLQLRTQILSRQSQLQVLEDALSRAKSEASLDRDGERE